MRPGGVSPVGTKGGGMGLSRGDSPRAMVARPRGAPICPTARVAPSAPSTLPADDTSPPIQVKARQS